jgi:hypothetical protein
VDGNAVETARRSLIVARLRPGTVTTTRREDRLEILAEDVTEHRRQDTRAPQRTHGVARRGAPPERRTSSNNPPRRDNGILATAPSGAGRSMTAPPSEADSPEAAALGDDREGPASHWLGDAIERRARADVNELVAYIVRTHAPRSRPQGIVCEPRSWADAAGARRPQLG